MCSTVICPFVTATIKESQVCTAIVSEGSTWAGRAAMLCVCQRQLSGQTEESHTCDVVIQQVITLRWWEAKVCAPSHQTRRDSVLDAAVISQLLTADTEGRSGVCVTRGGRERPHQAPGKAQCTLLF